MKRRDLFKSSAALLFAREISAQAVRESSVEDAYDLDSSVSYLNHASVGTMPRVVREAQARYTQTCESNPWLYVWGEEWAAELDGVHEKVALKLGAKPEDVALCRNTTAAFGLVANGLEFVVGKRDEVLMPSFNHTGASVSWDVAAERRGYRVRRFDLPEEEVRGLTAKRIVELYSQAISDRTVVMVLPHIDNVFGVRHPLAEITRAARARGVRFVCVDAAQSVGMIPIDLGELDVDLFATSAHKWLQCPKGTGVMVLSRRLREALAPEVSTWGRGRWKGTARAYTDFGTRALPTLLAIGDALDFHSKRSDEERLAHHFALFEEARHRCEAQQGLEWRSPRDFTSGSAVFALGILGSASARDVAKNLFEVDGIVLRPFEGGGRNHLRVSPNTMNTREELARLFRKLERLLG